MKKLRIGVISDTHNLLRPEALRFLEGSDHIVHAGDVCAPQVLDELRALAPLTAVQGNNDRGAWADDLPVSDWIELGGVHIHVIHDLAEFDIDPEGAGAHVVVSGHSHQPSVEQRGAVIYLNPGSADRSAVSAWSAGSRACLPWLLC